LQLQQCWFTLGKEGPPDLRFTKCGALKTNSCGLRMRIDLNPIVLRGWGWGFLQGQNML